MNRRKIKTIILIVLGIFVAFSSLNNDNLSFNAENSEKINFVNKNIKTSAVSGKIHIDNNWTAAESAGICTGNGIYSDPYIIEDLVIDGGGSGDCILIENSIVFFKIENCTTYNSGIVSAGIQLSYINNSQLINNNFTSNYRGISLLNSYNNTVSGNTVNSNTEDGIYLAFSDYNTVSGNTANDNDDYGIDLNNSKNNTVSGNTANDNGDEGIYLFNSDYNTISGNFVNYNNNYGINLDRSANNVISGNTANNNNDDGIYLTFCDYTTVSGNTANNNIEDGISLARSNNNTISENTANYNTNGIYFYDSDSNNISGNNLVGNGVCINEDEYSDFNVFDNNDCGEVVPAVPGYNLLILFGIISVVAVLLSQKIKKS